MITDISRIRKELEGYVEIELPYVFEKGCNIKYIKLKGYKLDKEDESFYQGGKFQFYGNDCVVLEHKKRRWSVPMIIKNQDGSTNYTSRFFIKEKEDVQCDEKVEELNEIIQYQQSIIENISERLKELEIIKNTLSNDKREYEELLHQNRYNYKEKCIENKEKDN